MTERIRIGNIFIGGGEQIAIQSMTNSDTADREKTLCQIKLLEECGCDIVRFTVNTVDAVNNIPYFKENTKIPLVADIHFDYKLAIEAVAAGIDKVRINPGNIGSEERVKAVCDACRQKNIPIRIGVNSGSLEKEILQKYGAPTAEALAESALNAVKQLEKHDFSDIVVSVKSSSVSKTIKANRILHEKCRYPLHIGVTEAGGREQAVVKSAIGIGSLLADGIGDTFRVSLTDDVTKEVEAARRIIDALDLRPHIEIVSCPTCGRTKIDLIPIAKELENELKNIKTKKTVKVALMGCIVNGPGEAADADVGVAGGVGEGMLFYKGVKHSVIPQSEILPTLVSEVKRLAEKTFED